MARKRVPQLPAHARANGSKPSTTKSKSKTNQSAAPPPSVLQSVLQHPADYLASPDAQLSQQLTAEVQKLYNKQSKNQLHTTGLTNEQIWTQLAKNNNVAQLEQQLQQLKAQNKAQKRRQQQVEELDEEEEDAELLDDAEHDVATSTSDSGAEDVDGDEEQLEDDNDDAAYNSDADYNVSSASEADDDDAITFDDLKAGKLQSRIKQLSNKNKVTKRRAADAGEQSDEEFTDDEEDYAQLENNAEDGFFDIHAMERFADQPFELDDNERKARKRQSKVQKSTKKSIATTEEEEDDSEDDDDFDLNSDVDLDADVSDVDLEAGNQERFDDFFDAPDEQHAHLMGVDAKRRTKSKHTKSYSDEEQDLEDEIGDEPPADDDEDDEEDEFAGLSRIRDEVRDAELQAAMDENNEIDDESESAPTQPVDTSKMSTFERQQHAMKSKIGDLEQQLLAGREWAQTGEVSIANRPVDSLLERHLEFNYATKINEPMTAEVTASIEEVIRRRIIEQKFDDVEKVIDVTDLQTKKKEVELQDTRSSKGLAELYEDEYNEQSNVSQGIKTAAEQKLQAKRDDIGALFSTICYKLDSLTNFHYTPKPPTTELVVTDSKHAALQLEEVIPSAVSSASLIAPSDLQKANGTDRGSVKVRASAGQPIARTEMSKAERERKRQGKKERYGKHEAEKAAERLVAEKKQAMIATGMGDNNSGLITPDGISLARGAGFTKDQLKKATTATNVTQARNKADGTKYSKSNRVFSKLQAQKDQPFPNAKRHKANKDGTTTVEMGSGLKSSKVML